MDKRYRVLIVDDEEPARELLAAYTAKLDQLEVVAVVAHALEAKRIVDEGGVDILLSDIQMDDLTGLDLVKTLKNQPVTIFTTAYSEYALEGYELDVIDYLVKPISFQRFCKSIDKALELLAFNSTATPSTPALAPADQKAAEYFFVKTNRKIVKVAYDELLFVESYGEYVKLYTRDDVLLALQTTGYMEDMLPDSNFFRIHRSYIINVDHIKEVEGNLVTIDSHRLTVSKRNRDAFMTFLASKGIV